jgi:DNA-binding LytR/AlgR family response regulator
MKIKCLIVDDETGAHAVLENYISRLDHLELVGNAYNAIEANQWLMKEKIDLLFLDINMPEITGLEFLQTLKEIPNVILTTAYSEFALDAYDLGVMDYLLKPIPFPRFMKAINKMASSVETKEIQPKSQETFIELKVDGFMKRFDFEHVLYFQGMGNYVKIITREKSYMTIMTMSSLEQQVCGISFLRVHKSFIVSAQLIKEKGDKDKIDGGKIEIPIGRSYKLLLNSFLNNPE